MEKGLHEGSGDENPEKEIFKDESTFFMENSLS